MSQSTVARPGAGSTSVHSGAQPSLLGIGSVVVLGTILSILDATIVNVAARTLGTDFGASITTIQWVLTGYLLAFASVIPITGWASERFGAKRTWTAALLIFVVSSALCGAAWSVESLIVFRILQGLGGGMIVPIGQMILAQAAGPERMGRVMSFIGLPMMLGSVAGPMIGGFIVSTVSWRWIFFVNLPIGLVAVLMSHRLLPASPPRPATRLDLRGLTLLSAGLAAFIYGLSEAGAGGGFDDPLSLTGIGVGAALVVSYVVHARARRERALIDISLFGDRGFAAAATTNLVVAIALFGVLILLPLYWQVVRGSSPLVTGLLLVPQALGAAAAMPLAGRLTDRIGAGAVVPVGIGLALVGIAIYTQVEADSAYWLLSAALFVIGLGLGATIMPSMAAAYRTLPRAAMPRATSALNAIQRVGASIGTATMAVILQRGIASEAPQVGGDVLGGLSPDLRADLAPALADAFGSTFWVAFAITAVALIPALRLPRYPRATGS